MLLKSTIHDFADVDQLVQEIESGWRGTPILLKQYLKLNGEVLGFSADPAFSNVLDGLIVVELDKADPRLLSEYSSPAEAAAFLAYHVRQRGPEKDPGG